MGEMDKMRQEEKAIFEQDSADMKQGLEGVKLGLKVLRDYYATADKAHDAADGESSGIVALLEVVESDFSKGLAEMTSTEEKRQATYSEQTKENEVEKAAKEQDVKYKSKESVSLDKRVTEASADRASVQEELDSVLEYISKLKDECVAKVETYEQR